jgi:6-phosphogluconolactonase
MAEDLSAPAEVRIAADEAGLAEQLTKFIAARACEAIASHGRFDIALAGGSTPKAAYAILAVEPYRTSVDWARVRFFFGDERCVPPGDPQSNFRTAHDQLFGPLGIAPERIFRMRGEIEPALAAAAYADVLRSELGALPRFDLVLLGMGPDGHTASLFPGTDPHLDDEQLVRAPWIERLGVFRITVTPRAINAARAVAIATAGRAKAEALKEALQGPHDTVRTPIQAVHPDGGSLSWFVDAAAAANLELGERA